jgi:alpha-D-xyloside xylohydrolase
VRITFHNDRLVFYLIAGPELKSILTGYCLITGFPPLPPMWSFLPWKWRNETNRDGVMEDAHKMRALDIPIGVMMIDRPWALGPYGNNDFEFDPDRYPDAHELIGELNGMGMEVVVWVCEFNRSDAKNFEKGLKVGAYCDGPQEGVPTDPDRVGSYHIDFRNPRGFEFWKTEMQKVIRQGIAGFKLDRGQSIGDKARYANGESGREMHNYHGYLFNQCCFEALQEIRGNDFTMLPRAGWAGSQKFAMGKWPGDMSASFDNYRGLPAVVLNQQTIGLSGFPFYGSDIGGFSRKTSVPVLARWVEHGALSPIMQCPHQPWEYGEEMVRIYRKYAKLHTELVPYIYHYAQVAHETGIPIARALVLEFQDDENVSNLWSEYMFGESLLVAPVIREESRREVYLPEGTWFDFWAGEVHRGPLTLPDEEEIPLDMLPLFVRGGAVLPLAVEDEVTGHGGTFSRDAITLDAYPTASVDWEKEYSLLGASVITSTQGGEKRLKVRCSAAPTRVVMRVVTPEPARVLDGGRPLARDDSGQDGTWFYDAKVRRAYVILEANRSHEVALIVD